MKPLNNNHGQTALEATLTSGFILSVFILGFILAAQFWSKNALTKWAALHSRCLAIYENNHQCELKIKSDLKKYFYFNNIVIGSKFINGVYHTKISVTFLGLKNISSFYNYQSSEFKRTSRD